MRSHGRQASDPAVLRRSWRPQTSAVIAGRPADGRRAAERTDRARRRTSGPACWRHGSGSTPETTPRRDGRPWKRRSASLEGGEAVAFGSGMAALRRSLDLLPVGARVVAPTDCYAGVSALLGGRRGARTLARRPGGHHRYRYRRRCWLTAPTWSGWSPPPTHCSTSPICRLCVLQAATVAPWSRWTTRSPPRCCSNRWLSARTSSCTASPSFWAATPTCSLESPLPTALICTAGCVAVGRSAVPSRVRWRPFSPCAACAPWLYAWSTDSAAPPSWPAA